MTTTMKAENLRQMHVGSDIRLTAPDGAEVKGVIRWLILDCALVSVAVEWDSDLYDPQATTYDLALDAEVHVTLTEEAAAALAAEQARAQFDILRHLATTFDAMARVGGSHDLTHALDHATAFMREQADAIAAGQYNTFTGSATGVPLAVPA